MKNIIGFTLILLCKNSFAQNNVVDTLNASQQVGKGITLTLDNFYNNEWRKDSAGNDVPYHYTWNDKTNNGFSGLGDIVDMYGVRKNTLSVKPTKENLSTTTIYLIVDPDTERETARPNYMQSSEVTVIADWVKSGGVLVLMENDSTNSEFTHFNQLSDKFGIHFNGDSKNHVEGDHFEQGAILIPNGNLIFTSARKVYIKEFSSLSVVSPASVILKKGDINIVAVAKYGRGTVFAVGDPWFYNEYLDGRRLPAEYENFKAANDLIKWLIKQSVKK